MKRITASEVRRNWFRILDEVVGGEVVVIERRGTRVVLQSESMAFTDEPEPSTDYSDVLDAPGIDRADEWSWEWDGEAGAVPRGDVIAPANA